MGVGEEARHKIFVPNLHRVSSVQVEYLLGEDNFTYLPVDYLISVGSPQFYSSSFGKIVQ